MFAFQFDGTVQAITEDGLTAWTADVNDASAPVADFQGGIVASGWSDGSSWIRKWDGTTGQPYPKYTAGSDGSLTLGAVHTDGTIFAIEQDTGSSPYTVVGIDPVTAAQKFSIPVSIPGSNTQSSVGSFIVAGDGYAYLPYAYRPWGNGSGDVQTTHLRLLRIDTTGAYDDISVADFSTLYSEMFGVAVNMITNGETGTLLSWSTWSGSNTVIGMATTNGTSVSVSGGLLMQGQTDAVVPMVQAQDGTFVGTVWAGSDDDPVQYMIAFDQSNNVLWTAPNDQPEVATADGGVIGLSGNIYDATGVISGTVAQPPRDRFRTSASDIWQMGVLPTQSWANNLYIFADVVQRVSGLPVLLAASLWAVQGANDGVAAQPLPDEVRATWDIVQPDPLGINSVERDVTYEASQGKRRYRASKEAVIKERLLYSYGQKPPSSSSKPGQAFEDGYGTRGKGGFGETQQFFVQVPGYRDVRVQIVPCTSDGTPGSDTWQNIVIATDQSISLNQDSGSTQGRTCRLQD